MTRTMKPPGIGTGATAKLDPPWRPTTVQPLAMPSEAPNSTSLRKWRLSCSRDVAT